MSRPRAAWLTAAAAAAFASAALWAAPATAAPAPRVSVMTVGQARMAHGPVSVIARTTTLSIGRRRCAVAAGTPLAALEAARRGGGPSFRLRDYGSCSRRPVDAGALFVSQVGADRNRGRDGWVYKVGRRVGTTGAADTSGPFGTGRRLRPRERLTWFYCRMARSGGCQRTLELALDDSSLGPGATMRATVRGYDDNGRGIAVAGATLTLAGAQALSGPDGVATIAAPATPGRYRLNAQRSGLVPAFPIDVVVA